MSKRNRQGQSPPSRRPTNAHRRTQPAALPPQGGAPTPRGRRPASQGAPGGRALLKLEVARLTDPGRVRDHNEDFVYSPPFLDPQQLARKGRLFLVADGMGGHQAGEVASKGAVKTVVEQYYNDTTHDIGTSLVRAFRAANRLIYEQAQADPTKRGMGTTLVAAVVLGRKVYIANVGDSRAYLINKQGIVQITQDHSWVEEQVRAGVLTREEAQRHPQRNVVTRALGSRPTVEVDLFEGEINEGDALLLCSDGLSGLVSDQELADLVRKYPPQKAAQALVDLANQRGGYDNISVLIASAQKQPTLVPMAVPPPTKKEKRAWPLVPALVGAALALLLITGALFGWQQLKGNKGTATPPAQGTTPTPVAMQPSPTPTTPAAPMPPQPQPPTPTAAPTTTNPAVESPLLPTATLAPTNTPSPSPTKTPRSRPTKTPSATSISPSPSPTYPAPGLVAPEDGREGLNGTVTFAWSRPPGRPLGRNDYFDLRIWSEEEQDLPPASRRGVIAPTKEISAAVNLDGVATIQEHGDGTYYWGVVVVRKSCAVCAPEIVGAWSETRRFTYAAPSEETPRPKPSKGPPPTPEPHPSPTKGTEDG